MKKITLSILLTSFLAVTLLAQNESYTTDSDPKATAILEKIKKEYESYTSLEIDFTLTLAFPEEGEEIQKGSIAQQGEKYRLKMGPQELICDGSVLWMFFRERNEVQINNVDNEDDDVDILSPQDLFTLYEKGDYIYALTNEQSENGRTVQQIEFKPTDRYSEYTKMRLTVDKKTAQVLRMKVFAKDGSRYTLTIDRLSPNVDFKANYFTFQKDDFPGVVVEDLRID